MSVSGVGNQIYINQNMHIPANEIGNIQNRFDLQSLANITALQEKEKQVEETRALEDTKELNPDRESRNQQNNENQKREKTAKEIEEMSEEERFEYFKEFKKSAILDIKV